MNKFVRSAMKNVEYDETLHKTSSLNEDDVDVQSIFSREDLKDLDVNMDEMTKHEFRTEKRYAVLAPLNKRVKEKNKEEYLLSVFDGDKQELVTVRKMFIEFDGQNTAVGFKDINEEWEVKGVYSEDLEVVRIDGDDNTVGVSSISSCLEKEFNKLPWFAKAACGGLCASCFGLNPVGCAACAGCIAGTGLDCL